MNRDKFDLDAYPFQIRRLAQEDGGGFLIEYPDVPGCTSDGETAEEAMEFGLLDKIVTSMKDVEALLR